MAARKSGEALVYKRIAVPKINEVDPTDNPSFGDMWIDISVNPPVLNLLNSVLTPVVVSGGGALTPPVTITGTNPATVPLTITAAAAQSVDVFDIKSNTLKLLSFNLTPAALTGVLDIRNIPSGASAISATAPDSSSTAFLAKSLAAGADWFIGLDSTNFAACTLIDGAYSFGIANGRDYGVNTSFFQITCPTNNLDPVFNNTAFFIKDNAGVQKLKIDIKDNAGATVKRFTMRLVRYDAQTGNIFEVRNEADSSSLFTVGPTGVLTLTPSASGGITITQAASSGTIEQTLAPTGFSGTFKNLSVNSISVWLVDAHGNLTFGDGTAAPAGGASQIGLGSTTATSATAGANGAVPAQVVGYWIINIGGTSRKIPFFAT